MKMQGGRWRWFEALHVVPAGGKVREWCERVGWAGRLPRQRAQGGDGPGPQGL